MFDGTLATTTVPSRRTFSTIALSAGFALAGAGTVMLGVLLPTLSLRWGLRDDQAGLLLFLQFVGSGMGAIVTGMNRIRSMAIGYGLQAAALSVLALNGARVAYLAFFFFGLGLGMAMTSTSLVFSDRWGDDRAAKLEWLNFAWSAGATAGPVCYLPVLASGRYSIAVRDDAYTVARYVCVGGSAGTSGTAHHPCATGPRGWPLRKNTLFIAPVVGNDDSGSRDNTERLAYDLFASCGDGQLGGGGFGDFDLLPGRDAEPAHVLDAIACQVRASGCPPMGCLGRDDLIDPGDCGSAPLGDSRRCRRGRRLHWPALSAGALLPA